MIEEARAYLEMLRAHGDDRHRPRALRTRIDAALASDAALAKYLEEDGTFDPDVLVLPTPSFMSMAGVLDEQGRPLREGLALPSLVARVPTELRACPYAGPRNGKPMNVTAFKIAGENWREFLYTLEAMRALYLRHFDVGEGFDVIDAFRVSQLLMMMPFASTYREKDPIRTGGHSVITATVYRVALGTTVTFGPFVFEHLWLTAQGEPPPEVTAALMVERAELGPTKQLIGLKEVCAGPAPMIEETLSCLLKGLPQPIDDDNFSASFARVIGDEGAFLAYATARLDIEMLARAPLSMHRRMIAADVIAAAGEHARAAAAADAHARAAAAADAHARAAAALDHDLPSNEYGDAGSALADDDRAVLIEHLMTPMFNLRQTERYAEFPRVWSEDRAAARALVASLLPDGITAEVRDKIADRFVVMVRSERALARIVAEAERAAVKRHVDVSEQLAEALLGQRLPAFFEEAFGLTRTITDGEIRVVRGERSVTFS